MMVIREMRLNHSQSKPPADGLLAPSQEPFPRDLNPREHLVHVYHQDETLITSITSFVTDGLSGGESVIVVATPEHRAVLERELRAAGLDPGEAAAQRRFFSLDAARTLDRLMVNHRPDPMRFFATIGSLMAEACAAGTAVRAFGEMVALMWAQGNLIGALELEDLWNELCATCVFRLVCA